MAWPTALTDDDDLTKHVFVQLITDLLESGTTFAELHKGAAIAIREWLEGPGGIDSADNLRNPSSFEPVAANWVVWQILRGQIEAEYVKLADEYRIEYLRLIKTTTPLNAQDKERGGIVGTVTLINQQRTYFTDPGGNTFFRNGRET